MFGCVWYNIRMCSSYFSFAYIRTHSKINRQYLRVGSMNEWTNEQTNGNDRVNACHCSMSRKQLNDTQSTPLRFCFIESKEKSMEKAAATTKSRMNRKRYWSCSLHIKNICSKQHGCIFSLHSLQKRDRKNVVLHSHGNTNIFTIKLIKTFSNYSSNYHFILFNSIRSCRRCCCLRENFNKKEIVRKKP